MGKLNYKWPFSIAMLNYQRVFHPAKTHHFNICKNQIQQKMYQQLELGRIIFPCYSHEFLKFYPYLRRRASGRLGKVVSQCQAQATTCARKQTFINLPSVGDFLEVPLNHPFLDGIFHCKPSPIYGNPQLMTLRICRITILNG